MAGIQDEAYIRALFGGGVRGPGDMFSAGPGAAGPSASASFADPEDPDTQAGVMPMAEGAGDEFEAAAQGAESDFQFPADDQGDLPGLSAPVSPSVPHPAQPGALAPPPQLAPTISAASSPKKPLSTAAKIAIGAGIVLGGYRLARGRWPF